MRISSLRYGWRIDPMFWIRALFFNVIDGTGEFPTTYLFLCKFEKPNLNQESDERKLSSSPSDSNLTVCAALAFEKLIARGIIGERLLLMLHGFNLTSLLVVPVVVINKKHEFIGPGKDKDVYVLALKSNTRTTSPSPG